MSIMSMNKFNSDGYYRAHSHIDIPTEPHYAVIESDSVYIEGDERSRTNPGHGYPAETRRFTTYIVFADRAAWEKYVKSHKDEIIPVHVTPAKIQVETKVLINLPRGQV